MGRPRKTTKLYRAKGLPPVCHPERKHLAHGLCNACHMKKRYAEPAFKQKRLAKQKETWRGVRRVELLAQRRNAVLQRKFGITSAQYEMMLQRQAGVCAVCKRPPKTVRLHVDHDHKTRRVRGLLCFRCNKLMVGSHTVETARKVMAYLEGDFDGRNIGIIHGADAIDVPAVETKEVAA